MSTPYQRILVPVDGSGVSSSGLQEALKLSQRGTKLRVLNVVDTDLIPAAQPVPYGGSPAFTAFLKRLGRRVLDNAASLAAAQHVKVDCKQRSGGSCAVSDVILEEARKFRADLIVMGTHGRRGVSRLVLGSDAQRVLAGTPVPLLLVGEPGAARAAQRRKVRR